METKKVYEIPRVIQKLIIEVEDIDVRKGLFKQISSFVNEVNEEIEGLYNYIEDLERIIDKGGEQ